MIIYSAAPVSYLRVLVIHFVIFKLFVAIISVEMRRSFYRVI